MKYKGKQKLVKSCCAIIIAVFAVGDAVAGMADVSVLLLNSVPLSLQMIPFGALLLLSRMQKDNRSVVWDAFSMISIFGVLLVVVQLIHILRFSS